VSLFVKHSTPQTLLLVMTGVASPSNAPSVHPKDADTYPSILSGSISSYDSR
jgi:hypothetical protein